MLWTSPTWIWITAVAHVAFALVEMTLWKALTPSLIYKGLGEEKALAQANATAEVGANMGFYNGIIAACLIWLLLSSLPPAQHRSLAILLLTSVTLAGLFGGATIRWTIPLVQSTPALIALVLLLREPLPLAP
jgi:putative membrane protein